MVIKVRDHVERCSTYEDGEVILQLLQPEIEGGKDVVLSFEGIDAIPSAFVNASVVRLAQIAGIAAVKAHLRIIDSTRQINDLIRSRLEYVALSR